MKQKEKQKEKKSNTGDVLEDRKREKGEQERRK